MAPWRAATRDRRRAEDGFCNDANDDALESFTAWVETALSCRRRVATENQARVTIVDRIASFRRLRRWDSNPGQRSPAASERKRETAQLGAMTSPLRPVHTAEVDSSGS